MARCMEAYKAAVRETFKQSRYKERRRNKVGDNMSRSAKRMIKGHGQNFIIASDLNSLETPITEVICYRGSSEGTGRAEILIASELEVAPGSILVAKGSNEYWETLYSEEVRDG